MGYRSCVVVTIKKSLFEKNVELILPVVSYCKEISFHRGRNSYILEWEDIKWYPSYPEINAMDKLIFDNPEDTSFIRIGEDTNDVETIGDAGDLDIYVVRTIDMHSSERIILSKTALLGE